MRMLFGFAVLSMLITPAFSAEPQVKLPANMIGNWRLSEDAAKLPADLYGGTGAGINIYNRDAKATDCDGCINIRQTSYDTGYETSCTIKKTERLARDAYLVRAACESEGSTFTKISTFQILAGQLVVTDLERIFPKKKGRK